MKDDKIREMIEMMKMDSSMQTETIKEKLKKLIQTAYDLGFEDGVKDESPE